MKIILGLLAVTFVAFFGGVGGFRGGSRNDGDGDHAGNLNTIVQVGNIDIGARAVTDAYNQQLSGLSRLLGRQIGPEQARQLGLLDQTVQQLVSQALIEQSAADLGVDISDQTVAKAVRTLPQLQAADGGFDPSLYEALLRQNGISEAEFVDKVRKSLARGQVLGTVQTAATAPSALVDTIYKYRQQRRIVETVRIGAGDLPKLSAPTNAQISAFYEASKDQFLAPEYRGISVASLSLKQLADRLTVDDADLRIDYEIRQNEFRTAERRVVQQAIFADSEAARRAREMVTNGKSFADAVKEVLGTTPLDLGKISRGDILTELAAKTFALDSGAVSDPIETPFGWNLMRVSQIIPEATLSFEQVRDQLAKTRALNMARNQIFEVMDAVIDSFAGGGSLEDAVQENGLLLQTIAAVSAGGTDTKGNAVAGLDPEGLMLRSAFSTPDGQDSEVVETRDGGFFVLRVASVTKPAPRPLADVRGKVAAAWQAQQITKGAQALASQLVDRVAGGTSLADAATEFGLVATLSKPVLRTGEGAQLPPALVSQIFESKVADISVSPDGDGVIVGRLSEIVPASDTTALVSLRDDLTRNVGLDIQAQLTSALQQRYDVKIDRPALDGLFQ